MTQQIRVYAADHDGYASSETFTDMAEAYRRFDEERAKPEAHAVSIEVLKPKVTDGEAVPAARITATANFEAFGFEHTREFDDIEEARAWARRVIGTASSVSVERVMPTQVTCIPSGVL